MMAPLHLEALLPMVVGKPFVACLCILIVEEEAAVVFISLTIVGCDRQPPRSLRIDLAEDFQVELVAQCKVVSTVSEVESACTLVAIRRHNESARIAFREREEPVGNGKRQRYIGHDEVCRSHHDIFSRSHLASREGNVEVGMFSVARRIAAMLKIYHAIIRPLRNLTA